MGLRLTADDPLHEPAWDFMVAMRALGLRNFEFVMPDGSRLVARYRPRRKPPPYVELYYALVADWERQAEEFSRFSGEGSTEWEDFEEQNPRPTYKQFLVNMKDAREDYEIRR